MRHINSHLNFELEIAKNQTDLNPIFYIQYAHARICNIIKKAKDSGFNENDEKSIDSLNQTLENELIITIINFPDIIKKTYKKLDPQIISNYLEDLAAKFHKYYSKHRIMTEDKKVTNARLFLIDSLRIVFRNALLILGIEAKERM